MAEECRWEYRLSASKDTKKCHSPTWIFMESCCYVGPLQKSSNRFCFSHFFAVFEGQVLNLIAVCKWGGGFQTIDGWDAFLGRDRLENAGLVVVNMSLGLNCLISF